MASSLRFNSIKAETRNKLKLITLTEMNIKYRIAFKLNLLEIPFDHVTKLRVTNTQD